MQSHTVAFEALPGVTFTLTRGSDPNAPEPTMGPPMPPEWITVEARNDAGDVIMSGGMLGPASAEPSE